MKLSKAAEILLVRTLAVIETPWLPIRHASGQAGAVHARRRGEVKSGLGGGGNADRQRAFQLRRQIMDAGVMVEANRTAGPELTTTGKQHARGLAWPFTTADLVRAVDAMFAAIERGDRIDHAGKQFVPEHYICGQHWTPGVSTLQNAFLPLLADGLIGSQSSISGRAFYFPIAERDAIFEAVANVVLPDAGFNNDLFDHYNAESKRVWDEAMADRERYSDLGEIPMTPLHCVSRRAEDDLTGIPVLFAEAATDG